jgi:eukaryotic-like serine/threonine-protein kinase
VGKEYRISRRIGMGGMAEVFLAMQRSLGGFEKLVVVKRIFEHLSDDEVFVSMFLEEARLAASLRHPNIVQIFDIDRDDAGYFIVMEYLPGEALADLFDDLRNRGEVMPVPIACRVAAAVAAGLHAAHTATDAYEQPQLIVHRDVTPSNIIVCYDGVTRLVDFGVAKARSRNARTQTGVIKGKMSYLAPEQVDESPVDARTDVFQLGIVLHEIVTGERLFRGQNDLERMSAVLTQPIPKPSMINPAVPPALDGIILRALERDRDRRTGSADQLRRELEGLLRDLGQPVSDSDLAEWMQSTFAPRREARVQLERSCISEVRQHTGERIAIGASAVHSSPMPEELPASTPLGSAVTPTMATVLQRPQLHTRPRPRSRRALTLGAGVFAVAFAAAFAIANLVVQRLGDDEASASVPRPSGHSAPIAEQPDRLDDVASKDTVVMPSIVEPPPPDAAAVVDTFDVTIATVPERAVIHLDGELVGTGELFRTFRRDGTSHELRISARGYRDEIVTFTDQPPPRVIRLSRIAPTGERASPARDVAPPRYPEGDHEPRRRRTDNLDPWADSDRRSQP